MCRLATMNMVNKAVHDDLPRHRKVVLLVRTNQYDMDSIMLSIISLALRLSCRNQNKLILILTYRINIKLGSIPWRWN